MVPAARACWGLNSSGHSPEELVSFYTDVIEAVEIGELDELIDEARKIGARGHGRRHGGKRGSH